MPKVLLIDDDDALAAAWRVRLTASGYDVTTACDGPTGLRRAREDRPDVIILDIRMPGMDGFEVCRSLKADAGLSTVPVLFMSANVQDHARQQAFDVGGAAFLTKPMDTQRVLAAVRDALSTCAEPTA